MLISGSGRNYTGEYSIGTNLSTGSSPPLLSLKTPLCNSNPKTNTKAIQDLDITHKPDATIMLGLSVLLRIRRVSMVGLVETCV